MVQIGCSRMKELDYRVPKHNCQAPLTQPLGGNNATFTWPLSITAKGKRLLTSRFSKTSDSDETLNDPG